VAEKEDEEEEATFAPTQAKGKGKGKAKAGGGAEIRGKCNTCRLMGTFCNGKNPCQRCVSRKLQCAYG